MTQYPKLALALAATAAATLRFDEAEESLGPAFVPAVAAMDDADRAYRATIERTLPPATAHALLAAMAEFRARVHRLREETRRELGEVYARFGRAYGAFDPLDAYLPPAAGLSHADGTRVAAIADGARGQIPRLRAEANAAGVAPLLPAQIVTLTAAKRARNAAFEAAIARALASAAPQLPGLSESEVDKARLTLTRLADGWY